MLPQIGIGITSADITLNYLVWVHLNLFSFKSTQTIIVLTCLLRYMLGFSIFSRRSLLGGLHGPCWGYLRDRWICPGFGRADQECLFSYSLHAKLTESWSKECFLSFFTLWDCAKFDFAMNVNYRGFISSCETQRKRKNASKKIR